MKTITVLLATLLLSCTPESIEYTSTNSEVWEQYEKSTLEHLNSLRDEALKQDDLLYKYAKERAKTGIGHEGFTEVSNILIEKGFEYVAENKGYGYPDPKTLILAWSSSDIHNQIMMNPVYKYAGVGIFEDDGKIYVCMLLGK